MLHTFQRSQKQTSCPDYLLACFPKPVLPKITHTALKINATNITTEHHPPKRTCWAVLACCRAAQAREHDYIRCVKKKAKIDRTHAIILPGTKPQHSTRHPGPPLQCTAELLNTRQKFHVIARLEIDNILCSASKRGGTVLSASTESSESRINIKNASLFISPCLMPFYPPYPLKTLGPWL